MTPKPPLKNVGASVRGRLTRRASERKENVQLTLIRFAIERLLYRLSLSPHRDQFVLKGAMLFSLWAPTPYRATGDLDLLGYGDAAPERIAAVFREICGIDVEDDGVVFKPETLQAEPARAEDEYSGVRVTMTAEIAGARLPIQIDIGFGDAVTPAVQEIDYPSLLDMPAPRLRAYPPETVVAEKFQALVALGMLNSRMKDFFDLWAISETFSFEGLILADAIRATFERRDTNVPAETPIALTPAFAEDAAKQAQWRGFLRRTALAMAPGPFAEMQAKVAAFVLPPVRALTAGRPFEGKWAVGGRWK
ncbi:nucleotidyl transferase AbiEii/AbiGii toxin family protein [Pelagibacterium halotolerans]|uniref:nucleotidyl transferase AbiEii/AbiGii toxin family protein n=1 Tax=Pelagibacterium halotolerans TaxID=531813 RepID=UPI00384E84F9